MRELRLSAMGAVIAGLACSTDDGGSNPPVPTSITINGGNTQVGPAGQALAIQLSVVVRDASNNPMAGVSVTWAAAGGGSVNPTTSSTGASGIASTNRTLGANAGPHTTTATVGGLTPVTFTATATVQGAVSIGSRFQSPLLDSVAAIGARTKRIEIGTAVIDMRYENPFYMVEDAGAADIIAGGRLQLGISRGSPEQVIDGWRHFGHAAAPGETDADMARRHAEVFLELLKGEGFAQPNPRPMFPNPPGLLRVEPHSEGLRDRIWWGSSSNATSQWAARLGMNLQSSTLKTDEGGEPLHVQQRKQIEAFKEAWKEANHQREARISVSRSIFPLVDERDRAYFGRDARDQDQIGYIDAHTRAIFGRSYAAEPDLLVKQLAADEAIAAADTLLLTVPNQLGVEYNAHVIDSILKFVAPELGWR